MQKTPIAGIRENGQEREDRPVAASPGTSGQPALRISHLVKTFRRADGSTIRPVDDVSLELADGEFLVLLGPSGCGKTTLLRSISGLEVPDAGRIEIAGRDVFRREAGTRGYAVGPEKRQLGMIFQSYALWPHMDVAKNVAYPLAAAKVPKVERQARVTAALELTGIAEIARQLPGQLSGGQQQRVALARALVGESRLILFDEPLSNVDAKVREDLRLYLKDTQRRVGFTAVYVTHDQTEAMELADRIAVLENGKIAQLGTPREVHGQPASRYVARFIGTANEVQGTVLAAAGSWAEVSVPEQSATPKVRVAVADPTGPAAVGMTASIIWRPESGSILDPADQVASQDGDLDLTCSFVLARYLGAHQEAVVSLADGTEVRVSTPGLLDYPAGTPLRLRVPPGALHVYLGGHP